MRDGILLVNKPDGMTSHDVVNRVRRKFKIKKVGHAGTLDPLATGVMVMLIGKSTKLSNKFMGLNKAYRSTMILGKSTDSADTQGKTIEEKPFDSVTLDKLEEVIVSFRGEIDQVPPMFSAVKKNGKKLYELARQGMVVERDPRRVTIMILKIEDFNPPYVRFYVECSKGTYIRQLAHDIGQKLGCGACISQIERTKIGDFSIEESVKLEDIDESHIRNWAS
jgi:tRNA pseudouridine55 synthase